MLQMTDSRPEPFVPMANRCAGVRRDGERCQSNVLVGGSQFCYSHEPTISDEAKYASRARGGYNSTNVARLERKLADNPTLRSILDMQAKAADGVYAGDFLPGVGTAIASLTRSMISTIELVEAAERTAILSELLTRLENADYELEATDLDEDEN